MKNVLNNLMEKMSDIHYGCIVDGENIFKDDGTDSKDLFYKNYHLLDPKDLINIKYGICYDQVELERYYLDLDNIKSDTYFIIEYDNENSNTHTFIVVNDDDKYYWFEYSWHFQRGIHEYNSLEELLRDVKEKFSMNGLYKDVRIFKYEKPAYGLGIVDFIDHCKCGKKIIL